MPPCGLFDEPRFWAAADYTMVELADAVPLLLI